MIEPSVRFKVNAAGYLGEDPFLMLAAKLGGRATKEALEGPRERLVGFKPGLQGQVKNRLCAVFQVERGPLEAQATHMLAERFAHQCLEDPMEVEGTETGDPRQAIQSQFLIEIALNVHQDREDPHLIVVSVVSVHASTPNHGTRNCPREA